MMVDTQCDKCDKCDKRDNHNMYDGILYTYPLTPWDPEGLPLRTLINSRTYLGQFGLVRTRGGEGR